MEYKHLNIDHQQHVAHVQLNRPEKANALNQQLWEEIQLAMEAFDAEANVRAIVISGAGKHFCGGIDLSMLMAMRASIQDDCEGRMRENLRQEIIKYQSAFTAIEKCRKPVLAAIQGACIGAGVDLITACDMRYAAEDAYFSVKEVDMGIVADVGTLQRLPRIVGEGHAREMAFTCRNVSASEAHEINLVNRLFPDAETMRTEVLALAHEIAAKSPLSVRGSKEILNYSRDHSVEESLRYVATWNSAMLLSEDMMEAMQSQVEKRAPNFKS